MSQPETIRRICPYLGLIGDPASHYREPDNAHACYSPKSPGAVEFDYQKRVCFSAEYGSCARFTVITASSSAPLSPVPAPTRDRRQQWLLLGLLILVPLIALIIVVLALQPRATPPELSLATILPTRTATARVTETAAPTDTPVATRRVAPTLAPLVIPTPPSNGTLLTLSADSNRTGWTATNEPAPRWGDRNLLVGALQNQTYLAIAQFDVGTLPPGSQVLYAVLELTGRDGTRLGATGDWQVELVDSVLAESWLQAPFNQIANAPALSPVGQPLNAAQLNVGQPNRVEFNLAQRQLLEKQLDNGTLTFRVRGPASGDNIFTWVAGSGTPTLYLVAIPGAVTIVTATPTPGNVLTAAAVAVRETEAAIRAGTPTRSRAVVTATPEVGVAFVTPTGTPVNAATALYLSQYATAVALTTGTFTPIPPNVRLITATPTPLVLPALRLSPVPTSTPTLAPPNFAFVTIPNELRGKIIAMSNRFPITPAAQITPTPDTQALGPALDRTTFNANAPIVFDPATGNVLGLLTSEEYYQAAIWRDGYSPDRRFLAYVAGDDEDVPQIWLYDFLYSWKFRISRIRRMPANRLVGRLAAHSPTWSPDGNFIAYVSNEFGNDDIFIYDIENKITKQITFSEWWWYKHPSWSPDGKKIVYWSNRTGIPQIWVMDVNGENQTNLSNSPYNEINPVWVK
ncbi:MAG: PD40 domain-containing protein [Chloroflexi bacterium]|nr:PD40 domain-containing protein [Chloroflexota bacterium]